MREQVPSIRECVVWRSGSARCELWLVGGIPYIRVFVHDRAIHQEPVTRHHRQRRAEELRALLTRPA